MIVSALDQVERFMVSREARRQDMVNQNTVEIEYEVKAAISQSHLAEKRTFKLMKQSDATQIFLFSELTDFYWQLSYSTIELIKSPSWKWFQAKTKGEHYLFYEWCVNLMDVSKENSHIIIFSREFS